MELAIYFFYSFAIVVILTPLNIFLARKLGLVSYPKSDRWHKLATPSLGGVAIFLSVSFCFVYFNIVQLVDIRIIFAFLIIFFSGLYDDLIGLKPYSKLIFQIISSVLVISTGIVIGKGVFLPNFIAIPLTIFWIIGITNALNLLDNMDGLCAGIAGIISIYLGIFFFLGGQTILYMSSFIVAGANFGFILYNFFPARIFMGDCGSLTLGFLLSIFSLMGTFYTKSDVLLSLGIPLLLMLVPIFDTTLVTISRKYLNLPISQGGKDHLSHRLVSLGYSQKKSVIVMYCISIVGGLVGFSLKYFDLSISLLLIIIILILFVGFGAMLSRVKVYKEDDYNRLIDKNNAKNITLISTVLMYKRQIIELSVDSIIIMFSLYFSLWLQFMGAIPSFYKNLYGELTIIILPFTLLVFLFFRIYSTIWRYLTIGDSFRYFGAVLIVFIAINIFIIFGNINLHFTTTIIFSLVLFIFISGFRLSEKLISTMIGKSLIDLKNTKELERVLIVGAGDAGLIALKEILQNEKLGLVPVGFIDDDPSKKGARINGFPVFGNVSKIDTIINSKKIDKIIISIANIQNKRLDFITQNCERFGKPIVFSRVIFKAARKK